MKRIKKMIVSLSILLSGFFLSSQAVFADDLAPTYEKLDSILHIDDGWLWNDLLRGLGWGTIRILVWLNNYLERIVTNIVSLNNFYTSPQMASIMTIVRPLVFGLFLVALVVLGYQFMFNKIEKRNEVLLNILLAVSVLVIVPVLMSSLDDVVSYGFNKLNEDTGTLADGVVKSNVADIEYYASNSFETADSTTNYIGSSSLPPRPIDKEDASVGTSEYKYGNTLPVDDTRLHITEKIEDSGIPLLEQKAVPDGRGDMSVIKLRDNQVPLTSLGKEAYYRYHVSWTVTIFTLIITAVALSITIIKLGRAIFDLAFHHIFALFVSVTDLTGGQRIKKVLAEIANTFGVMFVMVLILRLFVVYAQWVNGLKPSIGAVGVILMLIAGAWALIDAPDIVQRIMGIDAGLRSGHGAMMGAYAGARLAGAGGKKALDVLKGGKDMGSGVLQGAFSGGGSKQKPTTGGSGSDSSGAGKQSVGNNHTNQNNAAEDNKNSNVASQGTTQVNSGSGSHTIPESGQSQSNSRQNATNSGSSRSRSTIPPNDTQGGGDLPPNDSQGNNSQSSINDPNNRQSIDQERNNVTANQNKGSQTKQKRPIQQGQPKEGPRFRDRTLAGKVGYGVGKALNLGVRGSIGVTKGLGRATLNTARAISNPKQAIRHTAKTIRTGTKNVIAKGTEPVKRGIQNIARELRTPIGEQKGIKNHEL